jgi:hypothetical protein
MSRVDRPTGAVARAHRLAAAQLLQQLPLELRHELTWQDLGRLPDWLTHAATVALDDLALWAGALWHSPALHQCIVGPLLQAARDLIGPAGLRAVRAQAHVGVVQTLPAPSCLGETWVSCGRELLCLDVADALEGRETAGRLAQAILSHLAGWELSPCASQPTNWPEARRAKALIAVPCARELLMLHGTAPQWRPQHLLSQGSRA